jgi:hypothetical protein
MNITIKTNIIKSNVPGGQVRLYHFGAHAFVDDGGENIRMEEKIP